VSALLALRVAFLVLARHSGALGDELSGVQNADELEQLTSSVVGAAPAEPAESKTFEPRRLIDAIETFLEVRGHALEGLGALYEELRATEDRRARGAHYTPPRVADELVRRALAPLSGTDLRVCDPSMGSGAMLLAAARALAARAVAAGIDPREAPRNAVQSLYGIDKDPLAVELARLSLWLFAPDFAVLPAFFGQDRLHTGDALVGISREELGDDGASSFRDAIRRLAPDDARHAADALYSVWAATPVAQRPQSLLAELARWRRDGVTPTTPLRRHQADQVRRDFAPLHWELELATVFEKHGGFDAFVGNPPWVSYAGRAAHPLHPRLRSIYMSSPAFRGFRNLQSLFIRRSARLARPGGRLGFVLPTSTSDLAGYAATRHAHDQLAEPDSDLPDFGDGDFEGVFQPCMGLLSTRRAERVDAPSRGWSLARSDLDSTLRGVLAKLGSLPKFAPETFGERGYQTSRGEKVLFEKSARGARAVPLRTGTEVLPFRLSAPRLFCDPRELSGHFRSPVEWQAVRVVIRQTARYPMAALSDGGAFRNSVLAAFSDPALSAELLVAYLNSSAVRHYHYLVHRDARQGMPQLKIGHLRGLPAPPLGSARDTLTALGHLYGVRQTGLSADEQAALDEAAATLLDLSSAEGERARDWARKTKG